MLLASAPWYEFWAHGVWKYGEWTNLHASGWVWAVRGDFLIGLATAVLLIVMLSGEASGVSFAYSAGFVALWLVIPGVTVLLSFFALFAPAVIVAALVLAGWEQMAKVWHGRGDEASAPTTESAPPKGRG